MKTARFADIVKRAGAPETYLLWMPPQQDKVFQRAIRDHRVMTIHQEFVGSKKDFGIVGYAEEPNAQFLVFPKSLKPFADRRVVGINYDLLATAAAAGESKKHQPEAVPPKTKRVEKRETVSKPGKRAENVVPFAPAGETNQENRELKPAKPKVTESEKKDAPQDTRSPREAVTKDSPQPIVAVDPVVLREIKKAVSELRAGKAVPAYERLDALVNRLR